MTVTYRFTIRPPSRYTCPEGFVAMRFRDPPAQWDYGEVDYTEPLDQADADHYSLVPVSGDVLESVTVDGDVYHPNDYFGRDDPTVYAVGCGVAPRSAVEDQARTKLAESYAAIDEPAPEVTFKWRLTVTDRDLATILGHGQRAAAPG